MVIERLHKNLSLAQKAIANLTGVMDSLPHETRGAMRYAVMTSRDRITPAARERLNLLVGEYL